MKPTRLARALWCALGLSLLASGVPLASASAQTMPNCQTNAAGVCIGTVPVYQVGGSSAGAAATSANGSSTVAAGGTFQTALASNTARKGCLIQNPPTATEVLYVYFGANASASTSNSFVLSAGASINCNSPGVVLTDNVAVTGATTGHAFIVNGY